MLPDYLNTIMESTFDFVPQTINKLFTNLLIAFKPTLFMPIKDIVYDNDIDIEAQWHTIQIDIVIVNGDIEVPRTIIIKKDIESQIEFIMYED